MKKILSILFVAIMLFTLCVPCFATNSQSSVENLAKTTIEYDFKYVFLNKYKLGDYAFNDKGSVQCITFTEQGYQYAFDLKNYDNFGLYLYIYNPTQMDVILSEYNQVQLASNLFQPGYEKTPSYCKYPLQLIDSYGATKESDYATNGLILKFKMTNFEPQILTVALDERAYHVSSVELDCSTNAQRNVITVDTGRAIIDKTNEGFDILTIKGNSIESDDASMDDAGDGGLNVVLRGLNLLDYTRRRGLQNITVEEIDNGLIFSKGTNNTTTIYYFNSVEVEAGAKYTIQLDCAFENSTSTGRQNEILIYASNSETGVSLTGDKLISILELGSNGDFTSKKSIVTVPEGYQYLKFNYYADVTIAPLDNYKAVLKNIMVSKDNFEPYEPYVKPTTIDIPPQYGSFWVNFGAGDFLRVDKLAGVVRYYNADLHGYTDYTSKDWAQSLLALEYIKGQTTVVEATSQTRIPVTMMFENLDESKYKVVDYLIDYEFFFQEQGGFVASRLERPDRVLELDTSNTHTYYRIQSDVPGVYNDIRSVWFNVPNDIIKQYGELCALKAIWQECKLKPVLITKAESVYNNFKDVAGITCPEDFSYTFAYDYKFKNSVIEDFRLPMIRDFNKVYNEYPVPDPDTSVDFLTAVLHKPEGWASEELLVTANKMKSILDSYDWADNLFSEIDNTYYTPEDPQRFIATDLNNVGSFRVASLWEDFFSFGFIQTIYESDKSFTNITSVNSTDFVDLTPEEFCDKYYISSEDYYEMKEDIAVNKTMYLFRYTITDYIVHGNIYFDNNSISFSDSLFNNQHCVAELTAIRYFDIIEVHFGDVDNYVVFAVSHSPVNAITGITAPYVPPHLEDDFWQKVYQILMIILILVIIVAVIYVASKIWPFVKWMFPKRKKKDKKE